MGMKTSVAQMQGFAAETHRCLLPYWGQQRDEYMYGQVLNAWMAKTEQMWMLEMLGCTLNGTDFDFQPTYLFQDGVRSLRQQLRGFASQLSKSHKNNVIIDF